MDPPGLLLRELSPFLNPPGECELLLPQPRARRASRLCWGQGLPASVPSPLSPSQGQRHPSLQCGPPSPTGREMVVPRGEGSSFPATSRGFTMGMHLFIRAGFIFMEKLLWAGVVLGESAGLLSHARSCHGAGDQGWLPGPPEPPWGGYVSK